MYTQNTPVHVKLWHKDFWLMAVANLLLTVAVYIQIPLLPIWMIKDAGFSPGVVAVSLGIFGLGVFSLGFFLFLSCAEVSQKSCMYQINLGIGHMFLRTLLHAAWACISDRGIHTDSCASVYSGSRLWLSSDGIVQYINN